MVKYMFCQDFFTKRSMAEKIPENSPQKASRKWVPLMKKSPEDGYLASRKRVPERSNNPVNGYLTSRKRVPIASRRQSAPTLPVPKLF